MVRLRGARPPNRSPVDDVYSAAAVHGHLFSAYVRGPGGPGRYRPRAPTDPDVHTLAHPVPQIMGSLRA